MIKTTLRSLPVDSRFVPCCLESIIDKKIREVALNKLEKLVDWICSWIYRPYTTLYKDKLARIHTFSDKVTKLYDSSTQKIGKTDFEWDHDFVSINSKKVLFHPLHYLRIHFSKKVDTDFVVIRDDKKRGPGWYEILEQELPHSGNLKPMAKVWTVNTNELHPFGDQFAYLAKTSA